MLDIFQAEDALFAVLEPLVEDLVAADLISP